MSSTARGDEWKKYDKSLNKSVALEGLRDSVRQQDEDKVEKAIDRCRDAGLQDNKQVKEAGEIHLPVISARNKLKKACEELEKKGEDEGVRNELKSIKKNGLSPYLQQEVRVAKTLLERHEAHKHKEKPKAVSLAMDSKTVAEIRRYQNPPDVLRKVIQAALLLVGEDEDMTDSWKNCQRICNPYGNDGLCRRVINFDPSKAHPEIVARAKQILEAIEFDEVQSVGRSAPVTFYVWAMGSIEKSEAAAEKEEEKKKKQDAAGTKAPPVDKTEKSAAPGAPGEKEDKKQKHDPAGGAKAPTSDNKMEKSGAPGDKASKADEKHEKKEESKVKPANRKRQKEIFGRLPPPQDDKDFYNMTVTTKKKSKGKTEGGNPSKQTVDDRPPKKKTEEPPPNTNRTDETPSKAKTEQQSSKTKTDQQRPNDVKAK